MLLPVLMLLGRAQDKPPAPASTEEPKYREPAEEDLAENPKPKVYAFNPMQAQKELTVGNFYFKQGKFHSAALRFEEATKWNPGLADAWLRLGEADEKQNDTAAMRKAFEKYLELDPKSKAADSVRHKLASTNASAKKQ
jgi:tetratricopeptide (TPR) repeat protein